MRKLFLFFLFMLVNSYSLSYSQEREIKKFYTDLTTKINSALLTQKSTVEVSGFTSFNFYRTKFNDGTTLKQHLVQIEPMISYFIINDLSLGVDFSYHYETIENKSEENPRSTEQMFLGPVGKFYFGDEKIRPFVFSDFQLLIGDHFEGKELSMGAGIMVHVTGNIGLNLQVKYANIWSKKDDIDQQNRIFIGLGISNYIF